VIEVKIMSKGGEAWLSKALDRALSVVAVLAGLLLLFVTFSIGFSIFTRAAGLQGPAWVVQFNEYSLLWITFLAAGWVLKRGKHVSIDLLTGRLARRGKAVMEMVHGFLGMGVSVILLCYGAMVVWSHYQRGVTDVQVVDMPKYLILSVIPFGFLWLALQFLYQTINAYQLIRFGRLDQGSASTPQGPPDRPAPEKKTEMGSM
jgi:TRAP-type C4-dicarboxylate transport system permease small subunit